MPNASYCYRRGEAKTKLLLVVHNNLITDEEREYVRANFLSWSAEKMEQQTVEYQKKISYRTHPLKQAA